MPAETFRFSQQHQYDPHVKYFQQLGQSGYPGNRKIRRLCYMKYTKYTLQKQKNHHAEVIQWVCYNNHEVLDVDMLTAAKIVLMIEGLVMVETVMKVELVQMVEAWEVEGLKVVQEEEAVMGEVVEAVAVMEMKEGEEVVVEAVTEAKVGVEEENQEAAVENPQVEGATRWNCLKPAPQSDLSPAVVNPFQKNHP